MASVRTYFNKIRDMHRGISGRFGVDVRGGTLEQRATVASAAAVVATLVKVLVDKGYLTDAELQAAYVEALADPGWEVEPEVGTDPRGPTYVPEQPVDNGPPPERQPVAGTFTAGWVVRAPDTERVVSRLTAGWIVLALPGVPGGTLK